MSVFRNLLMLSVIQPEPPTPIEEEILLAKEGVKLLASKADDISYINIPQVLENTLDNSDL